jgi:hypothetical protein
MSEVAFDPAAPQFVDASRYHPIVDFGAYAQAAQTGALAFKVTQGSYLDPTANDHLVGAEQHGLVCIGFEFGLVNVNTFLNYFPPKPGRIPVLDFEGASISVSAAEVWINAVKSAYGRYPWFYGHSEWVSQGAPVDTAVSLCPYWGARYGGPLVVPAGVGQPYAFQFTDGTAGPQPHSFPGVSGNSDINMLIVSVNDLRTSAGLGGNTSAAPSFPGRALRLQTPTMEGPDVATWQQRLLELGWTVVGKADGVFGPQTDRATRGLQSAQRVLIDGIVGPSTWAAAWSAGR